MTFKSAALADSTPFPVNIATSTWPATVSLVSSAAGRLIELSTDGGATYFTPTYDNTSVGGISVAVLAPVSHARFTGIAGDVWSAR